MQERRGAGGGEEGRVGDVSLLREKYPHYHKRSPFSHVDVYRVLALFGVTDPCLQHAIKKLLVAGGRGAKDVHKDIREAIETLERWEEMRAEEALNAKD